MTCFVTALANLINIAECSKKTKETLSYRQLSSKSGFPLKQNDEIGRHLTPERDKKYMQSFNR